MAEVRIVARTISDRPNPNVGSDGKAEVEQALREYVGWKLHTMVMASRAPEGITLVFALVPDPDYSADVLRSEVAKQAVPAPADVPG